MGSGQRFREVQRLDEGTVSARNSSDNNNGARTDLDLHLAGFYLSTQ